MTRASGFTALGDAKYVSLTTFRKSGDGVSTAMWVALDGDALVISTHADSGKVKRLRNDSRVELRPCSATGKVEDGVHPVAGVTELVSDDVAMKQLTALLAKKYGLQHRLLHFGERFGRSSRSKRVILRITAG